MRVLFSSVPAVGHTFPLLPLARAFAGRGDTVAFLSGAGIAPLVEGFELLAAGPMPDVLFAEVFRRGGGDAAGNPTPAGVAEFFAGTRLDLGAADALAVAREWAPDLIINELFDLVGVFVATALDTPLGTVSTGPGAPPEFLAAITASAAPRFTAAGLTAPAALPAGRWFLETCPPALGPLPVSGDVWTLRPEAHQGPGAALAAPDKPRVLVTFGSHFGSAELVKGLLDDLADLDVDLVGTALPGATPDDDRLVPFQPLATLLAGVSAVVTHGGAGTVLGSLAEGVPVVVVPQGADQFVQAAAVARAGCGVAVSPGRPGADELRAAVRTALTDTAVATATETVCKEIAAMASPAEVALRLTEAVGILTR